MEGLAPEWLSKGQGFSLSTEGLQTQPVSRLTWSFFIPSDGAFTSTHLPAAPDLCPQGSCSQLRSGGANGDGQSSSGGVNWDRDSDWDVCAEPAATETRAELPTHTAALSTHSCPQRPHAWKTPGAGDLQVLPMLPEHLLFLGQWTEGQELAHLSQSVLELGTLPSPPHTNLKAMLSPNCEALGAPAADMGNEAILLHQPACTFNAEALDRAETSSKCFQLGMTGSTHCKSSFQHLVLLLAASQL